MNSDITEISHEVRKEKKEPSYKQERKDNNSRPTRIQSKGENADHKNAKKNILQMAQSIEMLKNIQQNQL